MSRKWITGLALVSCASLFAFSPFRQAAAPKAAPPAGAPTVYVVTFELSKWDVTKTPDQQPGFAEHHANVMKMAADGVLLVGGPFLESAEGMKPTGVMMIVKAENAEAAKKLVSSDPLVKNDLMKIGSVRAFMAGAGAWVPAAPAAPSAPKH